MIRLPADVPSNIVMVNTYTPTGREVLAPALGFLTTAALKYPTWKFELGTFRETSAVSIGGEQAEVAYAAKVYNERGIATGVVQSESTLYRCETVEFKNERIRRVMERGSSKKTTKKDVALKLLSKWFTEPPMTEKVAGAVEKAQSRVSTASAHIRSDLRSKQSAILNALVPYIMENIDELWSHVKLPANSNMTLDKFRETLANDEIAQSVMNSPCLTVLIEDDKYVVHEANSPIQIMTSDQLSEGMRRAIGLLKLSEKGQFIRGSGFHVGDNVFLVVKP